MSTINDLRDAFSRLEALTSVPTEPGATIVELTPSRPRRRAAVIGGGFAVAATVAGVVLATSLGGSSPAKTPAGGTLAPASSTVAQPSVSSSAQASIPNCPTENAAGVCATLAGAASNPSAPSASATGPVSTAAGS